jgi:hypothetical protein
MGFFSALAIVFITLKLIGIINWSWWLVLLPVYGGVAILIGLALLAALTAVTTSLL